MSESKHLWEVDHSYYCNDNNYYYNNAVEYRNWDRFLDEFGGVDMDFNLVFRWDWKNSENPDYEIEQDELHIYFMQQRKGIFISATINITKERELEVIEWLKPRYEHLMKLWQPFAVEPIPK